MGLYARLRLALLFTLLLNAAAFGQSVKGKLSGKIMDRKSGEALVGATVIVLGTPYGAPADLDGKYFLTADAGNFKLKVSAIGYRSDTFNVTVTEGKTNIFNISLDEEGTVTNAVEVIAVVKKQSTEMLLLNQRTAESVSSGISSEYIQKTPDKTVADALKRVSGTTIQEGKFAIVRGLADRYNMGFINGAPLPSSEPDKKSFSLDLIPSDVVEDIVITKTATPDMPGDFAGGFINIKTKDVPLENRSFITIGGGYNSLITGKKFYETNNENSYDRLGFDDGNRGVPANLNALGVNTNQVAVREQLAAQSFQFNNNFKPVESNAPLNQQFQAGFSRRFNIMGNEAGVIAAVTHNYSYRYLENRVLSGVNEDGQNVSQLEDQDSLWVKNYRRQVINGGILNLSYKVKNNHRFSIKNFISASSVDDAIFNTGTKFRTSRTVNERYDDNIYYYASNRMFSSQFNGEHVFGQRKVRLNYTLSGTEIRNEVPDYRRFRYLNVYTEDFPNNIYAVNIFPQRNNPFGSGRFYGDLEESQRSASWNLQIPLNYKEFKNTFKAGTMHVSRNRDYQATNVMYNARNTVTYEPLFYGKDSVFADKNFNRDGFWLQNTTQKSDKYDAGSNLNAGYLSFENKYKELVKVIWGLRYEHFRMKMNTFDETDRPANIDTVWKDWLPSVNLIISPREDLNIRLGAAKTLSRPEFREMASFIFYDINYNLLVQGNYRLGRANIFNYDAKIEWYPTERAVFSVNPFMKWFNSPIEQTVNRSVTTKDPLTVYYRNLDNAQVQGLEFEVRTDFAFLDKYLKTTFLENLIFGGNYTVIKGKINTSNDGEGFVQNRPLQGQSTYTANAYLNYNDPKTNIDVALSYNRIGRRIAFVELEEELIIWENPRDVLDFSVSKMFLKDQLRVKFTLADLLAQNLVFYQDWDKNGKYNKDKDVARFTLRYPRTTSISVTWNF